MIVIIRISIIMMTKTNRMLSPGASCMPMKGQSSSQSSWAGSALSFRSKGLCIWSCESATGLPSKLLAGFGLMISLRKSVWRVRSASEDMSGQSRYLSEVKVATSCTYNLVISSPNVRFKHLHKSSFFWQSLSELLQIKRRMCFSWNVKLDSLRDWSFINLISDLTSDWLCTYF